MVESDKREGKRGHVFMTKEKAKKKEMEKRLESGGIVHFYLFFIFLRNFQFYLLFSFPIYDL